MKSQLGSFMMFASLSLIGQESFLKSDERSKGLPVIQNHNKPCLNNCGKNRNVTGLFCSKECFLEHKKRKR